MKPWTNSSLKLRNFRIFEFKKRENLYLMFPWEKRGSSLNLVNETDFQTLKNWHKKLHRGWHQPPCCWIMSSYFLSTIKLICLQNNFLSAAPPVLYFQLRNKWCRYPEQLVLHISYKEPTKLDYCRFAENNWARAVQYIYYTSRGPLTLYLTWSLSLSLLSRIIILV